mgnify:CR=1 FL=1
MNITRLRELVENLPNDITAEQFASIELEVEDLLATHRQEQEAELAAG